MKKIILLIFILLGMSGCYDYQELNKRAIIEGISVDYDNSEFIVNFEILSNKKEGSKEENKIYFAEGNGLTLTEALHNATLKISKEAYYPHLKILVLSENVAKNHLEKVIDFILREPTIRNIFYPIIAKDTSAKEILDSASEENPITSETIEGMLEFNQTSENISAMVDFEKFMNLYVNPNIDPYLTTISKSNDKLSIDGIAVFDKKKLVSILSQEETAIFNVLNNTSSNHALILSCKDNKNLTINLYQNKNTSLEIKDNILKIKSNLTASVIEDNCGYDFRDAKIYQELGQKFSDILKSEYIELFDKLKQTNTDILGIQNNYYLKNRKKIENWTKLKLETDIKIDINKNGLIFEVTNE